MRRGEIYWASLPPPVGRRPAVVLTRDSAIPVLQAVTIAPLTRTVRGTDSEVPVGREDGVEESVVNCDNVATVPKAWLDPSPVGSLQTAKIRELDRALRFALEIGYSG